MGNLIGWIVALVAVVRFLPSVNEGVSLQTTIFAKWFVALRTVVPPDSTVGLLVMLVMEKATSTCKCLVTLVARLSIRHFLSVNEEVGLQTVISAKWFVALWTIEPLARVRLHVALQMTRRSASIIALVTLEWLFSCVHPHHVIFQLTSMNAGKLALRLELSYNCDQCFLLLAPQPTIPP